MEENTDFNYIMKKYAANPQESHKTLHSAIQHCNFSQVASLLEEGERPCTLVHGSCFEIALGNKDWNILKLLLNQAPDGVNIASRCNVTALMLFGHNPECVQYLLNLGADVHARNNVGYPVLMHVLLQPNVNLESVMMLINAGADVNAKTYFGVTTLMQLFEHNNQQLKILELLKILIEAGANVNAQDLSRNCVLSYAIQVHYTVNSLQAVSLLIDAGADIKTLSTDQINCLLLKTMEPKVDVSVEFVKMLIDAGANVNAQDKNGKSVLMLAATNFASNLEVDSLEDKRNCQNKSLLIMQNIEKVKVLIDAGADVNAKHKSGDSILQNVVKCYSLNEDLVKILIAAGADVNAKDEYGNSVIIHAIKNSKLNVELLKVLIAAGANVNAEDKYGDSVIIHAVKNSKLNVELLKVLIAAGANVNAEDIKGNPVIIHAVMQYTLNEELIKALIAAGADVNAKDKYTGYSVLSFVVQQSTLNKELGEILIAAGADVNAKDKCGNSVLIQAVQKCEMNGDLVMMLIAAGADVNAKDKCGNNVLMLAVQREISLKLLKSITAGGCNILAENNKCETVLTAIFTSCNWIKNSEEMLLIIHYLLDLPELKHKKLNFKPENHPQQILLKNLSFCDTESVAMLGIFKVLIHSQFKDTTLVKYEKFPSYNLACYVDASRYILFGAIACMLNKYFNEAELCVLQKYVQVLLEAGFSMQHGISPLTVFICHASPKLVQISDTEPSNVQTANPTSQFIDFLIEHGAHVQQQMLHLQDAGAQEMKTQLYLSDALFSALVRENLCALRQLLPYWGFPGLYLLLFSPQEKKSTLLPKLFPVLIEHGGVPHGTAIYKALVTYLSKQKSFGSALYLQIFEEMHSSPLSLMSLCLHQVRASLAGQASRPGHNLPQLVKYISPPGLKDFLLMQSSGDPGMLVCHNQHLVQAAQQQMQEDEAVLANSYDPDDFCGSDCYCDSDY